MPEVSVEGESRGPGVKMDRWGSWLFEHRLETYLSIRVAAIFAGLLYITIGQFFGIHPLWNRGDSMAKLKDIKWWSNFWAAVRNPSASEIFEKAIFETCRHNNQGLTIAFTIDNGQSLAEIVPHQPNVDFDRLCAQLLEHTGKPMSEINELSVTL